jgi:hypothetical protein
LKNNKENYVFEDVKYCIFERQVSERRGLFLWSFIVFTNTNEKINVTVIASPTLHRMVYRAKGAAISSLLGIASSLRSSQ